MRIGITMRVVENETYPEKRDALGVDWAIYIKKIMPQAVLIPLVNEPSLVEQTLKELAVDGVILSNGNDWGSSPKRDLTEKKIIKYCAARNIPLLGVCRGFQVLNVYFGGHLEKSIQEASKEKHANTVHTVEITDTAFVKLAGGKEITVNSFHKQGFLPNKLAKGMKIFAKSAGGAVEGIYSPEKPILGIQWHPERKNPSANFNRKLITNLFSK